MKSIRVCLAGLLLVAVAACGGYSSPSAPSPTPAPAPAPAPGGPSFSVAIPTGASLLTTTAFNPDVTNVTAGTTVTWTNNDSTAHTSTSNESGWNSGSVAPGGRFSFTFQQAGTFPYHCAIHPGMVGTVVVR